MRHTLLLALVTLVALAALSGDALAGMRIALADGTQRPQPYQRWADAAATPLPAKRVTLRLGACPDTPSWATGCALPQRRLVYLQPHTAGPHALFHELGHVYDATVLSDGDRLRFQRIAGGRGPWAGPPETDPPIEKFAEAYSLCARKPRIARREFALYGYSPSPAQHRRVCALIAGAGS